ncbi:MAG: hypothetical protein MJ116_09870 [Lachnospiraceae bacterium]|nr:hypothetical protein [Lachnospiraceae bacterium]
MKMIQICDERRFFDEIANLKAEKKANYRGNSEAEAKVNVYVKNLMESLLSGEQVVLRKKTICNIEQLKEEIESINTDLNVFINMELLLKEVCECRRRLS